MIRRPPRSTLDRSSAASDVYKRQDQAHELLLAHLGELRLGDDTLLDGLRAHLRGVDAVSYTHLRAHETVLDLVCRLLLEKKKTPPNILRDYIIERLRSTITCIVLT